ncbi:hypothetical protein Tco_0473976 [Tanacetum coccineum]
MSTPKFAETHNLVAFLEKPEESTGFEEIIDFLNASYVQYALSVNPTIYTTCIEQLWTSAKLDDIEGIDCLPTATIFFELERMGYGNLSQKLTFYKAYFSSQWNFLIHTILQCLSAKTTSWNEFSSTMASAIICIATNQKQRSLSKHKGVYVTPSHTKKVFANMKRPCKGFSGRVTLLFSTMMVQATEDMGEEKDSAPTKPTTEETPDEAHVSTPSYDPPQIGEDSMQLSKLMNLCTSLQENVLYLEKAKIAQAKEIANLKKRVKQLEKRRKLKTTGLKRLRKISSTSSVESSNDASLGAQEDAYKQGRKIADLDA